MQLHHRIAAWLRGLSYDGSKGLLVRYLGPGDTGADASADKAGADGRAADWTLRLSMPANETSVDPRELFADLLSAESYPARVFVEGVGSFALGRAPGDLAGGGASVPRVPSGEVGGEPAPPGIASGTLPSFAREKVVEGKICAVTGAAQGFGLSIVRHLAGMGAYVWLADMNLDGAKEQAERINAELGTEVAFAVEVNVAKEESVQAMAETIAETSGGLDVFVSNAGVLRAGSVKELTGDDFALVTSVNYTGYFFCVKHISPLFAAQNDAAEAAYFTDIIQINSKSGLEGSNKNGAYAGGKFGGIGLTQSFAKELVTDNIKVNSLCPGNFFDGPLWSDPERGLFVQYLRAGKVPGARSVADVRRAYEEKVPMNRGCTGEDVVRALLYVVEQRYETGQALPITGGQNMLR